jgi:hypothetical protein
LAGAKLRRGYEPPHPASMEVDAKQEEIDNSAARLPVTCLLLCVHGIGQNLTGANIAGAPTRHTQGCSLLFTLGSPNVLVLNVWSLAGQP